ncbi:CrcB protein [Brevibacterium paucivorans]|uniref:Fluoride-specific ion channel FluC n=1 Tax=Brevibacterium paucivorans TaxID=170994 RepID=A0ABS2SM54_9MICO|nr:CrcB protein [Brevibacterium paucivorans]
MVDWVGVASVAEVVVLIAVIVAGGVGAVCRWACDTTLSRWLESSWPAAVFIINVVGSFLTGFLTGATVELAVFNVCVTGFCGAFTTFSTLMVGWLELTLRKRPVHGVLYAVGTVLACVLSVWLGLVTGSHL